VSEVDPRRWWTLALVLLAILMVVIDTTVLTVSIPTMRRDLDTTLPAMQWVVSGYALSYASFLVIGGRLGDMYGPRRLLLAGATLFGIGSFIASNATSVPTLILGEAVIEGIGAALLTPSSLAILANTYSGRDRSIAYAAWGTVMGCGSAFGPLLGGYLTSYHSWRWAFRVNVIIVPVVLLGTLYLVRRDDVDRIKSRLDFLGAFLVAAGCFLVVFGATQGDTYGWWAPTTPFTIGGNHVWPEPFPLSPVTLAFTLGTVLLVAFVRLERGKEARGGNPLFEFSQFRYLTFRYSVASTFLMSIAQTGGLFVLPLFLQDVKHLSAIDNGLWILPMGLCIIAGAQIGGFLSGRVESTLILRWGLVVNVVGLVAEAFVLRPGVTYAEILPVFVVYGLGAGLFMSQLMKITLSEIPPTHSAGASAVNSTARQTGGAFGAAIIGSIFAAVSRSSGIGDAVKPALLASAVLMVASAWMAWKLPPVDGKQDPIEGQVDLYSMLEPADAKLKG
jgi:EmrB/QacA subfamily drug resistance transporter